MHTTPTTLALAQQPITRAQKAALHTQASVANARISFTSPHGVEPHIIVTAKNLNVRCPHTQDGYQAAQAMLAQFSHAPGQGVQP